MATIDRVEPSYQAWSPSTSGFTTTATVDEAEEYVGKHRRRGPRALGLLRLFYTGKHRA